MGTNDGKGTGQGGPFGGLEAIAKGGRSTNGFFNSVTTPTDISVLVVSPDSQVRDYVSKLIKSMNESYFVDTVGEGEEALQKARDRHYDIAVLGVNLNGISGLDILREITSHNPDIIPIMLAGSEEDIEIARQCMELGARDYLTMPIDERDFRSTLKNFADMVTYRSMSIEDGLTRLYTRKFFNFTLEREIDRSVRSYESDSSHGNPVSLLIGDLDNFKGINDRFGHPSGDEVLRIIADVIMKEARRSDYACRYGGDEYGIILPNTDSESAQVLAERIRLGIETKGAKHPSKFTTSIGVVTFPPFLEDRNIGLYIAMADQALYQAKEGGRNRVVPYIHNRLPTQATLQLGGKIMKPH